MAKSDALLQVSRLVAMYGQDSISPERVDIYADFLKDVEPELLRSACDWIMTRSKFFPYVPEIGRAALRLSGLSAPTPAEAMATIRRADVSKPVYRRDGSYAYTERFWEWPEDMSQTARDAVLETLSKVGEPCDEDGKPHFGWETGFQKTYEIVAEEVERPLLADMSGLRLPAPQAHKTLPMPPREVEPNPDDKPIPMCGNCGEHMGFFDIGGRILCVWCRKKVQS